MYQWNRLWTVVRTWQSHVPVKPRPAAGPGGPPPRHRHAPRQAGAQAPAQSPAALARPVVSSWGASVSGDGPGGTGPRSRRRQRCWGAAPPARWSITEGEMQWEAQLNTADSKWGTRMREDTGRTREEEEGTDPRPKPERISISANVLSSCFIYIFFKACFHTNWFLVIYPLFISFLCHD